VVVTEDSVYIARFKDCGPVLWLIDDFPVEEATQMDASDVAQIDLLTSPVNTIAFGERGKCGVIAIYTKDYTSRVQKYLPIYMPFPTQAVDRTRNLMQPVSNPNPPEAYTQGATYIKSILPLGFQKPVEFYAPKYDSSVKDSIPDMRTTIHWLPSLSTDEAGKASFRFYTADSPSTYSVVIEGLTNDGKIIYKREKIVVNGEK